MNLLSCDVSMASNGSSDLTRNSWELRKQIVQTLHATGGGHYGGALSVIDILLTLYTRAANLKKINGERDRILLSKGHSAVALYCLLAHLGIIDSNTLTGYGKFQKKLEGHPDMLATPGVDFSSGSLGQGLSVGMGMALGLKDKAHVWVILGDGECQEGQIWEAALLAARYKIDNIHVIVDANNAQEFGYKQHPTVAQEPIPNMAEKWEAFGWSTHVTQGHDLHELERSLLNLRQIKGQPSILIAKTKKGSGVTLFEMFPEKYHCIDLNRDEYTAVMQELGEKCSN